MNIYYKILKLNIFWLPLFAITVLTTSCKQKSLVAGFRIGMDEKDWRDSIKSMLNRNQLSYPLGNKFIDSLHFIYNYNLQDTVVKCEFSINNDGIIKGKSRVFVWDFIEVNGIKPDPTDPHYPTAKQDSSLYGELSAQGYFITTNPINKRISYIAGGSLPKNIYSKIFNYANKILGEPDSVLDANENRIDTIDFKDTSVISRWNKLREEWDVIDYSTIMNSNGTNYAFDKKKGMVIDTSRLTYYFHDDNSVIVLERSYFYKSNYYIPFEHVTRCRLYEYSKTYENEFKTQRELILKDLKPSDLITIKLHNQKENKSTSFGLTPVLTMRNYLHDNNRNTLAESREIESMKGRIEVSDEFGSILQNYKDIVIDAKGALTCPQPGLYYALGEGFCEYINYEYVVSAYLESKSVTDAFKKAYKNNDVLITVFIPEAIKFKDGTVLK